MLVNNNETNTIQVEGTDIKLLDAYTNKKVVGKLVGALEEFQKELQRIKKEKGANLKITLQITSNDFHYIADEI